MDYDVSDHITCDLHKLSIHNNYGGNDDIIIGDDKRILITHYSSIMFCTR
ncbi:hypothetical protein GW17_00048235 [Ensete ventricosum]|nr:hypothetical protein GW17_00048235 [Ensete ventricosum]